MYEERQIHFRFGSAMSPMVKKLIIATAAVFVLQLILGSKDKQYDILVSFFSLIPIKAVYEFQIWRFITYAFLHSPYHPFHILFNMLGLYFFGPDIERNFGSGKHFLFFYLAAALVGGICQAALAFIVGGVVIGIPIIGASAAVMAVIIAAALYTPNRMVILFIFPMKLKYLAILFVGVDILNVLQDWRFGGGTVARLAHLGGAAFGFLYIRFLLPRIRVMLRARRQSSLFSQEKQARDNREEMDRILTKIHNSGMASLTEKERRFLMEQSRDIR